MIDLTENDLVNSYRKIKQELSAYDEKMNKKREIIFFNKSDLLSKIDINNKLKIFKNKIGKKYEVISVFKNEDIKRIKETLIKYA